eukprot:GHVL01033852.1.p1 GENE.GHVL01033852.1~~GHVL01033852.1.p1  ORF type:complete len:461 (+),score=100.22 GHVL01033852.1:386-1768(+)
MVPFEAGEFSKIVEKKHDNEKMERAKDCFIQAFDSVPEFNCKFLGGMKDFVTVEYLSCYLKKNRRPPLPDVCDKVKVDDADSVAECTSSLSDFTFGYYTELHNHIDDLCGMMQAEAWRSQTDETVNRLADSARGMTKIMHQQTEKQDALLQNQIVAIDQGQQLQIQIIDASQDFRHLQDDMGSLFGDVKTKIEEHHGIIQETLGSISSHIRRVLQVVSGIKSLMAKFETWAVFGLGFIGCCLLASFQSTRRAFPKMITIWASNLAFEWYVKWAFETPEDITRYSRWVIFAIITFVAIAAMFTYKPPLAAQLESAIRGSVEDIRKDLMKEVLEIKNQKKLTSGGGLRPNQESIVQQMLRSVLQDGSAAGHDSVTDDPDYEPPQERDSDSSSKSKSRPRRRCNPSRSARPKTLVDPLYQWRDPSADEMLPKTNWKLLVESPSEFGSLVNRSSHNDDVNDEDY